MGNWLEIESSEANIRGYLAVPDAGKGPGVLVCHAWWGLNEFVTGLCDRLAGHGFVALAADMYEGRTATTIDDAQALVDALTSEYSQLVATTALDTLLSQRETSSDRAAAIGFSLGGYWAIWLSVNRPEQVAAVTTFYGAGEGDFAAAEAAYQGHFAPDDEWEPQEWVRSLETAIASAGRDVTFHWYDGAGHWFFEDNRPDAYNADAADLAWERTLSFLHTHLPSEHTT